MRARVQETYKKTFFPVTTSEKDTITGRDGEETTEDVKKKIEEKDVGQGSAAQQAGIQTTTEVVELLTDPNTKDRLIKTAMGSGRLTLQVDEKVKLGQSESEVLGAILTPQEMVNVISGHDNVKVSFEVKENPSPSEEVKALAESRMKEAGAVTGQVYYFDADLFLSKTGVDRMPVTKIAKKLKFTFEIPESMRGEGRSFFLVCSHKDTKTGELTAEVLQDEDDNPNTITVSTDKLCTMALSYAPKGTATPTSAPAYTLASSSSGNISSWSSSSSGSDSSSGSTKNESYSAGKGSGSASYIKTGKHTVKYLEPKLDKKARIAVVPDEVRIGKKMFKVTSVSTYAFIGHDSLHMVKLGKNVKKLEASAFAGCYGIKTLKVSSRNLTAKSVKGCLTDSRINKVLVTKKAADKLTSYKKAFSKENSSALQSVAVKKASN